MKSFTLLTSSPRKAFRTFLIFSSFLSFWMTPVVSQPADTPLWVRDIFIRGNEKTEPDVILREMVLEKGSRLTDQMIEMDRERIYNLGIFNRVDIDRHALGDSADLYVEVDERWYLYPFPIVGIRHRDWNKIVYGFGVAHSNLAGLNQKLFAQVVFGYDRWMNLNYANPRFLGTRDYYFGLNLSYSNLHPLALDGYEFEQERWLGKVSLGKRFGLYRTLVGTAGVESWRAPPGAIRRTASSDGRDVFGTISLRFVDDRRYLREYPMSGSYLMLSLAKDGFGTSQMDLLRLVADIRRYIPVWSDWSLALRAHTTLTSGGVVPSYRHVFFGYSERIRGEFRTVREGEAQAGANIELRIPLVDPRYVEADFIPIPQFKTLRYGLYGALYIDAGKVWYRNQSPVDVPLRAGYGAGLHAILPYGLVARAELGISITGSLQGILDAGVSF